MGERRRIAGVACLAVLGCVCLGTGRAGAEEVAGPRPGGLSLSVDAFAGRLSGTASEYAYERLGGERFKLSELTWDFSGATVGGARADLRFGGRFTLSFAAWRTLDGGDGTMVDRDWMYTEAVLLGLVDPAQIGDEDWTHESRHPDTTLDEATLADASLAARAWRRGPFELGGVAGVRAERWRWSARGGTYVYSVDGFRDRTGEFKDRFGNDLAVIDYEQRYALPYLGATLAWEGGTLRVAGRLLAGAAARASDEDYHVLRDTTFEGDFTGGWFRAAGVEAAWRFLPRWRATLAAAWQRVDGLTGDVTMTAPEGRWRFQGGGGVALEAATLALGVGLSF